MFKISLAVAFMIDCSPSRRYELTPKNRLLQKTIRLQMNAYAKVNIAFLEMEQRIERIRRNWKKQLWLNFEECSWNFSSESTSTSKFLTESSDISAHETAWSWWISRLASLFAECRTRWTVSYHSWGVADKKTSKTWPNRWQTEYASQK